MLVFNVANFDNVKSVIPIKGSVALREIYIWSRWYKPQNDILFSYQLKHQKGTYVIKLTYGKTYTFEDIRHLLGSYFNRLDTVFNLTIDNQGRVNLDFKNEYAFENLKICKELAFELKLPYKENYDNKNGNITIGTSSIQMEDIQITFSDTDLVYIHCDSLNESDVFFRNKTSTLMTVFPIRRDPENKRLIKFKDNKPLFHLLTKRKTVYNLSFSILSQRGNTLPFYNAHMVILNK